MKDELKEILDMYKPSGDVDSFDDIIYNVCLRAMDEVPDIHHIIYRSRTTTHDKYIAYLEMISIACASGYGDRIRKIIDFDIKSDYLMTPFLTLGLHINALNMRFSDQDALDSAMENCHWRILDLLNVYFISEYNYIPECEPWIPQPLTRIFGMVRGKYNKISNGLDYVDIEKLYDDIFFPSGEVDMADSKYAAGVYGYLYDWCFHYFPGELIKWVSKDDDEDDGTVHPIPASILQFLYVVVINECCPKLTDRDLLDKAYRLDMNYYEKMLMFLVITDASDSMTHVMSKDLCREYGKLILEVMKQWKSELI